MSKLIQLLSSWVQFFLRIFGFKVSSQPAVQVVKYLMVGVVATAVDFVLLYSLTEYAGFYYLLSATIGFSGGAVTNYVLNKLWTFENQDKRIARQFSIFVIVALVGIGVNNLTLYVSVEYFGWWYIMGKVLATALALIWNFFGHKYISFRQYS